MSDELDILSEKIQRERHLQTVLLSFISIGLLVISAILGFIWLHVDEVRKGQQRSAVDIGRLETAMTGIERTQSSLSERMDELARDRFTGAEARSMQSQLNGLIGELRGEVRANQAQIRAVENEVARQHGPSRGG